MGDRYDLDLKCAYCNELNGDIYYAPTSNFDNFKCKVCNKTNFITYNRKSKKLEEVTHYDIKKGFVEHSFNVWEEEKILEICLERLKEIKKLNE